MTHPVARLLLLWSFLQTTVCGFQPVTRLSSAGKSHSIIGHHHPRRESLELYVATTAGQEYIVEVVEGGEDDPRVLDVAAFRNGMVNPEMMVERAKSKRDAIDTTEAAVNGLKIGVLYVGPVIAAFTYLESNDVTQALSNYALLGGGIGVLLAANNYMGRGIHVPDTAEATNRIIVDFSEGIYRKQDIGFVAVSEDSTFAPTRGVMGTVDAQLRNSDKSHPGARKVSGLPSHLHIKNMEVHKTSRRRGVGQALLDKIIEYAKTKTDAEALTLEVEAANPAAVNLYKKAGFEARENPNKLSKNVYMVKFL